LILFVYLDVEDTHHRSTFLDGGTVLTLPIFCLEGICVILHGFEYGALVFVYLLKWNWQRCWSTLLLSCFYIHAVKN